MLTLFRRWIEQRRNVCVCVGIKAPQHKLVGVARIRRHTIYTYYVCLWASRELSEQRSAIAAGSRRARGEYRRASERASPCRLHLQYSYILFLIVSSAYTPAAAAILVCVCVWPVEVWPVTCMYMETQTHV